MDPLSGVRLRLPEPKAAPHSPFHARLLLEPYTSQVAGSHLAMSSLVRDTTKSESRTSAASSVTTNPWPGPDVLRYFVSVLRSLTFETSSPTPVAPPERVVATTVEVIGELGP